MKMPGPSGVISVYGNQVEARRIEHGMSPGQKPVHVLEVEQSEKPEVCLPVVPKVVSKVKPVEGTKEVILFPEHPEQTVLIGKDLSPEREAESLSFLRQNVDVFAWSPKDLLGIDRSIVEHRLDVDPSVKPIRQKMRQWIEQKAQVLKAEVQKLLDAGVIREIDRTTWLVNPVLVKKPKE